jgi:hypothetical protein
MIYNFKSASRFDKTLDPQAVGERLANLPALTPANVVEDARPEDAPTHAAFTWDDAAAAAKCRLEEARYLIRMVVTVTPDSDAEERAFVPVTIHDTDDQEYVPLNIAMNDADYRAQVLHRALNELLALKRKYQELYELAQVFAEVDSLQLKLNVA